ncbi:hypothetical protein PUP68_11830 [Pseudomonas chlororaphis]|nr:hypothetical protein [Pseudomonas chlororaphis]AZD86554.1 hypothetical protein C4K14_3730 [Pseudomonas chlororaphis subsp. aureofaciens]WDG45701.1 hypothetical protein PUP58_18225 [Pseudomonas chlororaphis]WDG79186.1 hypothetical protein PUP77_00410 [Pseudomonas chlororaphis]WDG87762.1 hypothetical protein PUP68_11830 [Pseudomonas chlororaphis]
MKITYWILAALYLAALLSYGVARESAETCQLPALSTGTQR